MKSHLLKFSIVLVLFLGFSSCNKSDDGDDATVDSSLLLNKWWYVDSNTTADLYFGSDGSYEQYIPFGGGTELFGTWEWVNEAELIMKITYTSGNSGVPSYVTQFTTINSDTMSLRISFDEGVNYTGEISYQDTEI